MQLRVIGALLTVASLTANRAVAQAPSTAPVFGLGTHLGLKAGLNRSVLAGQINPQTFFKTGFSGGIMMRVRASRRFAVQPELLYAQLGAGGSLSPASKNPDYEVRLNYLTVPLLFKFYFGDRAYLQAGPQVGFLLSGRRMGINPTTPDQDVTSEYGGTDFAVTSGVGVDLACGLVLGARLAYGFTNINTGGDEARFRDQAGLGGLHNRNIELSVGYLFGAAKY